MICKSIPPSNVCVNVSAEARGIEIQEPKHKKKIDNALLSTSFENLSQIEKKDGFHESAISSRTLKKIKFFNLGKKNDWKILLDKKIIKKIESRFKNEMTGLGYL